MDHSSPSLQRSLVALHPDSVIKQDGWKVRPGSGSGASSYAGSDDEHEDDSFRDIHYQQQPKLESLRKEIQADGELTKLMVRIEVRFCRGSCFEFCLFVCLFMLTETPPFPTNKNRLPLIHRSKKSTTASLTGPSWAAAYPAWYGWSSTVRPASSTPSNALIWV